MTKWNTLSRLPRGVWAAVAVTLIAVAAWAASTKPKDPAGAAAAQTRPALTVTVAHAVRMPLPSVIKASGAIAVLIPEAMRRDLAVLSQLRVPARGGPVPIDSVAQISIESGPSQIDRYDRRNVSITADLGGHSLGDALQDALALGLGSGDGSFRRPMAIAVIGGLITSTALSLLVVPASYTYVAQFERFLKKLLRSRATPRIDPAFADQVTLSQSPPNS